MNKPQFAEYLYEQFEQFTRDDQSVYWRVKQDYSEHALLNELTWRIHQHFDALPNDWLYESVVNVLEAYSPPCDENQDYHEIADPLVMVYTADLLDWTRNHFAQESITEVLQEGQAINSYDELIQSAQYHVLWRIAELVDMYLDENLPEDEEENDD